MLNYHELTMNEPRDSPQRRKQFLVISAIMFLMTVHAGLNAGVFYSMDVTEGTFGGGEFVYKFMRKDYAASTGALRTVASDLGVVEEGGSSNLLIKEKGEEMDTADLLYSVLLDDLSVIPGGDTRFASGLLLPPKSDKGEGQRMKRMLLDANDFIRGDESDDGRHPTPILLCPLSLVFHPLIWARQLRQARGGGRQHARKKRLTMIMIMCLVPTILLPRTITAATSRQAE
mmetsp:Transcript_7707/g.16757  ORF Transcript_7707/g.16757 Transcript_7707/m.16757 type:complete len:230 (+) Transcript_7707:229-918(+)